MWWIAFVATLFTFAGAIWRWGAAWAALCFVALTVIFQVSSALYLLPLSYYKDGGDGDLAFDPAWIVHAAFWTIAVFLAVWSCRLLRKRMVR